MLLLLLLLASLPAHAAKPEVDALVARLARPPGADIAFVEVRYSHLVKRPLRSSGVLRRSGATLEKRMLKPRRERVAIDAKHAVIERNGETRRIALARAPELGALRASFAALMDGNAAELDRHFETSLERAGNGWTLKLVPRDEKLRRRATIEIRGAADVLRCVSVVEPDDDASVMAVGVAADAVEGAPPRAELLRHCRGGA
ncbi:MAG TPA: LolA-related protein [Candidatus Saccharimonadia bacterium]|nr:LolA-related protein [Candidatus Saccharimonadia bacterium]